MQWHPLGAYLLKLLLGRDYEGEAEEPVSELPRRGDIVLAQRENVNPGYTGLWSRLCPLNVLELKGPSDDADPRDLDLLMHVGTGITCRRNEKRQHSGKEPLRASQSAYWYLAARLGDTFLGEARLRTHLQYEGQGVWRGQSWGHPIYLVAYHELPEDEEDAVPLHLLRTPGNHPPRKVAELVARNESLRQRYGVWFATLHAQLWREVGQMPELIPSDWIQWEEVLENVDVDPLIQAIDLHRVIAVRGLDQVIQAAGLDKLIQTAGPDQVTETLLSQLTPEQQEQLRQRLEKKSP